MLADKKLTLTFLCILFLAMLPLVSKEVKATETLLYDFETGTDGVFLWGNVTKYHAEQGYSGYGLGIQYDLHVTGADGFQLSSGSEGSWGSGWNFTDYDVLKFYMKYSGGELNTVFVSLVDNASRNWGYWIVFNNRYFFKSQNQWQMFIVHFADLEPALGSPSNTSLNFANITTISFQFVYGEDQITNWDWINEAWVNVPYTGTLLLDEVSVTTYTLSSWNVAGKWVITAYPAWANYYAYENLLHHPYVNGTITHLNPSWYRLVPNGTGQIADSIVYLYEGYWIKREVLHYARYYNVPFIPLINNFVDNASLVLPNGTLIAGAGCWDLVTINNILNNTSYRENLAQNLLNETLKRKWHGICIDFEGITPENRNNMNLFMSRLYDLFNDYNLMVMLDVPAKTTDYPIEDNWAHWVDLNALKDYADVIVVMCYDRYSPWGNYTNYSASRYECSIAPIDWVNQVLNYTTSIVAGNKILLGVGGYGYDWGCSRICDLGHRYDYTANLMVEHEPQIVYDYVQKTPRFQYFDQDSYLHTVHFENYVSLYYKLNLANNYTLKGMRLWYLGCEQGSDKPNKAGHWTVSDNAYYWRTIQLYKNNNLIPLFNAENLNWVTYETSGFRKIYPCLKEPTLPVLLAFGLAGFMLMLGGLIYIGKKGKEDFIEAVTFGFMLFVIGVGCVIVWLWS